MAEVSAELIYEVLKTLQRDVSQVKGQMGEMNLRMHAFELTQNAVRQEVVGIHTELASIHATLIRHDHRLERIGQRLELDDSPTITA